MIVDWISGGLDPPVVAALLAVSFAGSFVTVSLGLGGGLVVLATLASLVPSAALIPLHAVIQLGSNSFRAILLVRHTVWAAVGGFALGALAGAVAGGRLVVALPPEVVQIAVGVFVLWTIATRPPAWMGRLPWLTGILSTALTFFVGATGPFVATVVRALDLDRQAHVATHAMLMTIQHGLKVVVFGVLGFAFAPWLGFLAAMIASGALGTLLGARVLRGMSDRGFRLALNIVLTLIACRLIWQGLSAL